MPPREQPSHRLATALQAAFGDLSAAGRVDIVPLEEEDAFEVQADHWTLYLRGWPLDEAWIALDEEGASAEEQRGALQQVLGNREIRALHTLDRELAGRLLATLATGPDPLSATLAAMLDGTA